MSSNPVPPDVVADYIAEAREALRVPTTPGSLRPPAPSHNPFTCLTCQQRRTGKA